MTGLPPAANPPSSPSLLLPFHAPVVACGRLVSDQVSRYSVTSTSPAYVAIADYPTVHGPDHLGCSTVLLWGWGRNEWRRRRRRRMAPAYVAIVDYPTVHDPDHPGCCSAT